MDDLGVREAIYSLQAMRRLRPDPVPDEELAALVDAATQAASASNSQDWAFVVVTEPSLKQRLGDVYREVGLATVPPERRGKARYPRRSSASIATPWCSSNTSAKRPR